MKLLTSLFILVILPFQLMAAELQGELNLVDAPSVLREGDLIEGVLKVWPIENADLIEFNRMENAVLDNTLVVINVESVAISENNADVIVAKLQLIVKKNSGNEPSSLDYKGQQISLQLPSLKIEDTGAKLQDYIILDQGMISSRIKLLMAGILLAGLFIFGFFKRNSIKDYLKRFKNDPVAIAIKKFNELFLRASTRQDYETIYAERKNWLTLCKLETQAHKEFFKTMEMHQYKRLWGDVELSDVKRSFDFIRRSLSEL